MNNVLVIYKTLCKIKVATISLPKFQSYILTVVTFTMTVICTAANS